MQPWSTTTCSQDGFFDVYQQLTLFQLWWRSTFDGVQLLVELSYWWSSSSHSFGFAQWWRFRFSYYYCCCAHLSAMVERCLWHRLVHTATQLSKQVPDLLATGPGFDPHWQPSGWQHWPSSTSYIFREEEVTALFWLVVDTSMECAVAIIKTRRSNVISRTWSTPVVLTVVVIIGAQRSLAHIHNFPFISDL